MIWLTLAALAQDYSFPSTAEDYGFWYITAYKDQGGSTDWNCGSITYPGHGGSDFGGGSFAGMDEGRDVTAAAGGTVIATNDGEFDRCVSGDCAGGGGFGNYVYVEHPDGKVTIYGHLKQWSVAVGVGDVVSCGQFLGQMGSSGYSTGPHLHFQVNGLSGYSEDPFDGPCSAPPTYWTDQGPYDGLPGNTCASEGPCIPVSTLACGDVFVGRNDGPGSTQATWDYGCTDFTYSGPELSWSFATSLSEPVTLTMSGLSADLDLYAAGSSACDGSDCLGASSNSDASDEVLVFEATAGTTYTIIVDGWEGAVSDLTLTVACAGAPLPDDTGVGPTGPGTEEEPTDGVVDTDSDAVSQPRAMSEHTKLGCATVPSHRAVVGLALLALLVRRRRA